MNYTAVKAAEAYERGLADGRAEVTAQIAAAEERGRRAGIEAHIRDLHAIENALDEFETDPPTALRVVGEHVGMALHNLLALAPRDSGKETDHG